MLTIFLASETFQKALKQAVLRESFENTLTHNFMTYLWCNF